MVNWFDDQIITVAASDREHTDPILGGAMDYFRGPRSRTPDSYTGQYVLARNRDFIPPQWNLFELGEWSLGTSWLPVVEVRSDSGLALGWCIGYPLVDNLDVGNPIYLTGADAFDVGTGAVEAFYRRTWGRYVLVLLSRARRALYLDPHGSLAAVYSTSQQIVASTPTLMPAGHDWNENLIEALDFPNSDLWFPSGLTAKKGVRRLLPNHCLDLDAWNVRRHWPEGRSSLEVEPDVMTSVRAMTSAMRTTIGNVAASHPIQCTLTAGRDSRTLLACARPVLQRATFFTHAVDTPNPDTLIASRLAAKFGLRHFEIPYENASVEEMKEWLFLTGHSVSGTIWRIHRGMQSLDRASVLMHGTGGELGRGIYGRPTDHPGTALSASELARRAELPDQGEISSEIEKWSSELAGYSAFTILDLFYIEQTLGCWSAPQFFSNECSLFAFSPFNHRTVVTSMMRLPHKYKKRQQLVKDICLEEWPELLELPFNDFTGDIKLKRLASRIVEFGFGALRTSALSMAKVIAERGVRGRRLRKSTDSKAAT